MKRKTPNSRLSPNRRSPKRALTVVPRLPVNILRRIFQLAGPLRNQNRIESIRRLAQRIRNNNPYATRNYIVANVMLQSNYTPNEIRRALPVHHHLFV
jgi:hypothetical protein